jgi:hypothetical protein
MLLKLNIKLNKVTILIRILNHSVILQIHTIILTVNRDQSIDQPIRKLNSLNLYSINITLAMNRINNLITQILEL